MGSTHSRFGILLAAALGIASGMQAAPPAAAFPASGSLLSPRVAAGLFPKIRYPKVNIGKGAKNVGKGAKAVLYPVTKTTVNSGRAVVGGGKAVVNGGVVAVKGAEKGAEIYEAGRSLSSKTNGVPALPHLK